MRRLPFFHSLVLIPIFLAAHCRPEPFQDADEGIAAMVLASELSYGPLRAACEASLSTGLNAATTTALTFVQNPGATNYVSFVSGHYETGQAIVISSSTTSLYSISIAPAYSGTTCASIPSAPAPSTGTIHCIAGSSTLQSCTWAAYPSGDYLFTATTATSIVSPPSDITVQLQ